MGDEDDRRPSVLEHANELQHRGRKVGEKITACTNAEELVQYMVGAREDAAACDVGPDRAPSSSEDDPMARSCDAIIIGAGPAGLATAAAFRARGPQRPDP